LQLGYGQRGEWQEIKSCTALAGKRAFPGLGTDKGVRLQPVDPRSGRVDSRENNYMSYPLV